MKQNFFNTKQGDKNYYTLKSKVNAKATILSLCNPPSSSFEVNKFKVSVEGDKSPSWWYIEDLRLIKSKEEEILHNLEIW